MRRIRIFAAFACLSALGAACSQPHDDGKPTVPMVGDAAPGAPNDKANGNAPTATRDLDAGAQPVTLIGALFMQTPIMSDMEWPLPEGSRMHDPAREKVVRIGYIRKGGKVPVLPQAHKKPNCLDGWYELVAGGFVCGKYATLDLNHPVLRLNAPHPPDMNAPLPYQYGYNLTHGTPLYRAIPSHEERLEYEPWLSAKARPKKGIEEDNPYASAVATVDAGAPVGASLDTTSIALSNTAPMPNVAVVGGPATASSNDPLGIGIGASDGDGGTPWYLRDFDGGKPQITLDELRGEGPVVRRMVRGFFVALDKEEEQNHVKWWKTIGGNIAPYDRIMVQRLLTEFHGVWLGEGAAPPNLPTVPGNPPKSDAGVDAPAIVKMPTKLPVAFVLWNGHKYTLSDDHKKSTRGDALPRWTAVGLTGNTTVVGGFRFHETEEGWWFREADGRVARPGPVPKGLLPNEKWIDVNLTTQSLVAFEGEKPVYVTLVSTGKKSPIKEKNHETKPGEFRIREKHIAATMDGDVASDGPYSIEDVPWIMYFNGSIALHGAFWHSNFGNTRSHGCVNLSPLDARAMFGWTDPPLPEGWHGVMATAEHPGTRVIVHDPPKD